ncbi:class I SAM-dependent methyltransferase [Desulfuromonas thiophila]|uniref:Methyltransferase domain-containing protein n=1 Tax=Desulfuromonas thiophila TaxID=57664 RepID=A0A1G7BW03_9BACT|nr:class I SAM-dependent methyltransferase [Desulfuromonas thiophila]SDE30415.1 Methyltransferase domain-containing protein [Desulfuromonas thiophila]
MAVDFYRVFEDRYRGSRLLIKERQKIYLEFVAPLSRWQRPLRLVDLGCGRGEWLELLREQGFEALGIDSDDQMLAACRERGLTVATEDVLDWLVRQSENSCDLISAFHLVEHLAVERVDELVCQSLRVLRPGGLLLLETPNPENLLVSTHLFYLDPTHQRPFSPHLLAFLPEFHGFVRTRILRLHGQEADAGAVVRLQDVLEGASQDYAVIAQKAAATGVLEAFDGPFAMVDGIDTTTLAQRYDQQHFAGLQQVDEGIRQMLEREALLRQRLQAVEQQQHSLRLQLDRLSARRNWGISIRLRGLAGHLRHRAGAGLWFFLRRSERVPFVAVWFWRVMGLSPPLLAHLRCFVACRERNREVSVAAGTAPKSERGVEKEPLLDERPFQQAEEAMPASLCFHDGMRQAYARRRSAKGADACES